MPVLPYPAPQQNTILLRGQFDPMKWEEKRAAVGANLQPGMICDLDANDNLVVAVGPTNGLRKYIVLEDGKIGMTKTSVYADGQLVPVLVAHKGEHYLLRLKGGQNVTRTTKLIIENGQVIAGTTPDNQSAFAFPRDPQDNSALATTTFDFCPCVIN